MSQRKPKIKPLHLALVGVGIVIVGILVPSVIVNAYSTIGLSVIIGGLVLLSAYVLFCVNTIRVKGARVIGWLLLPVLIVSLGVGGWYMYHQNQQDTKNRIYNPGEVVSFDDFDFTVTNTTFKDIDLSLDKNFKLDEVEDCSGLSQDTTYTKDRLYGGVEAWGHKIGPSDYETCNERNEARKTVSGYVDGNKRLVVNYTISSKEVVETSSLKVNLSPDSGRDPNNRMEWLNNGSRWVHKTARDTRQGITRDYWESWTIFPIYTSHGKSDLGGNINKGLDRKGYMQADIRNAERSVDVNVTYNGESRIIRISR